MVESRGFGFVDPEKDRNRSNPNVHYRLYDSHRNGPTVICVQDFDYADYDEDRFLTYDAYSDEREAEEALFVFGLAIIQIANRFRSYMAL